MPARPSVPRTQSQILPVPCDNNSSDAFFCSVLLSSLTDVDYIVCHRRMGRVILCDARLPDWPVRPAPPVRARRDPNYSAPAKTGVTVRRRRLCARTHKRRNFIYFIRTHQRRRKKNAIRMCAPLRWIIPCDAPFGGRSGRRRSRRRRRLRIARPRQKGFRSRGQEQRADTNRTYAKKGARVRWAMSMS